MGYSNRYSTLPNPPKTSKQIEDKGEPIFICTICWRPQHAPSKPKLLGSSARIVCNACWIAVLDLSICWVCGEYIVRGDEVVSLGWCFWHKACFGCLVCGSKMSVPSVEERGDDEKRKGIELEKVPLCEVCSVEMDGESPGKVLEKGVQNVSRFDGGLSKARLQRLSEVSDERMEKANMVGNQPASLGGFNGPRDQRISSIQSRTACPRCSNQQRPASNTNSLHKLLHSAMDTKISGDGSVDSGIAARPTAEAPTHSISDEDSPDVYVSIFNPIEEAAFKSSKTKPLPKWMNLLPNNIHREREQKSESIGYERTAHSANGHESANSSESITPKASRTSGNLPTPPINIPNTHSHRRTGSKVSFEPNLENGSVEGDSCRNIRRSQNVESAYATPPEYPRPKTPFPRETRPSLSHHETTSYFSHRPSESSVKDPWEKEDACCDLGLKMREPTLTPELTSPKHITSSPFFERPSMLPAQSSEYLDRYRPKSAATQYDRYVAKEPEPILSKLKRQQVGNQNLGQVADEREKKRQGKRARSPRLEEEEYGVDPRRKDLHQELRSLFCEK